MAFHERFVPGAGETEILVPGFLDPEIGIFGSVGGRIKFALEGIHFGLPQLFAAQQQGGAVFLPPIRGPLGEIIGGQIQIFNLPGPSAFETGLFFTEAQKGIGPGADLQGDALFEALERTFPSLQAEHRGVIELAADLETVVRTTGPAFVGGTLPTQPFTRVNLAGQLVAIPGDDRIPLSEAFEIPEESRERVAAVRSLTPLALSRGETFFVGPTGEIESTFGVVGPTGATLLPFPVAEEEPLPIHQELFPTIFGSPAFEVLDQPGGGFEVLGAEGGGGFLGDIFGDVVAGAGDILGDIARAAGRTGIALLEQELRDRFGVQPTGIPGQAPPGTGGPAGPALGIGGDLGRVIDVFTGESEFGQGGTMATNALGRSIFQAQAPMLFHVTPAGRITPNSLTLVADGQGGMSFFVNAGRPTHFSRIGKWPRSRRHHHHPR